MLPVQAFWFTIMHMNPLRVLSVQDISCYGQCSLTVALPILSALGIETPILPTAILSTHTSGFQGFTFRDLSMDLPSIVEHWKKERIAFDAVYTGYLGSSEDVAIVKALAAGELNRGPLIVDPAFGDNGVLYGGFTDAYVASMRELCFHCDVMLPNLTEACALLGIPFVARPTMDEAKDIAAKLVDHGAKSVVLKGIGQNDGETGVLVYDGKTFQTYFHHRLSKDSHGTGDVFASVFVGSYMRGLSVLDAATMACDFTYRCIQNTMDDESHAYGVKFEPLLGGLAADLEKRLK